MKYLLIVLNVRTALDDMQDPFIFVLMPHVLGIGLCNRSMEGDFPTREGSAFIRCLDFMLKNINKG